MIEMDNLYRNGALTGAYFGRQSAWHTLGLVGDEDPIIAFSKMGIADEKSEPLVTASGKETPWSIITRTNKNGEVEFVSEPVADSWFWLSHAEAASIAFQATGGSKVETMGVLGMQKGDMLFCTFPLRDIEIVGQEHKQYVFFMNSLRRHAASVLGVTDVCMVCQNTVDLGLARARSIYRAPHRPTIVADTLEWFKEVWGTAAQRGDEIKVMAEKLATFRMDERDARSAMQVILPFRSDPKPTGMRSRDDRIERQRELSDARTAKAHSQVIDLFMFQGAGLNDEGVKGTRWGLYQSLIEYTDHFRPSDSAIQRAEYALVGETVRVKARAAKVLLTGAF